MAKIGKMDSEIRELVEIRTKKQVFQSIIDWINKRSPGTILANHTIHLEDKIYETIPLPQERTLEFLLAYLDDIFKVNIYQIVLDAAVIERYSGTTFKMVTELYAKHVMANYDKQK